MLDTAAEVRIQNVLSMLDRALTESKSEDALELFTEDRYWRDLVTFT